MKPKLYYILVFLLMVTQGAWGTTAYVSTYAELSSAIANASVDNIVVTANIDVPCETSVTSTANPDYLGASTAQLVISRSLTLQSQAGYQYTIKRIAANGATTDHLKSLIAIRGNGNGTSGTANLTENTVEVTFTNIIIDGGANWGTSTVSERRTAATTAYGNAGRAMIDVFMGGTLNLEDGVVLQNGFTTYSINSVVNDSGSNNYGGAVRVEYHPNYGGGTVNLKAGATIHDCSAQGGETAGYGGALGAYNFAHLNVYGGAIYNCSAAKGGAIGCTWRSQSDHATSGTINLFGGTIHHCYANTGGAILTEGTVADYLLGGTISDCTAASEGGAIAIPEAATQVHIVDHSSGWLTISNCSPNVAGSEKTGYYPCVSMHADATISSTPVYQVTFQNNNTEFAVLNVLQGNSLGEAFPAAPVNANFRFVGWYNGNTQVTSSTAINDNITVTAKWDFLGSGTAESPYLIPSADVWNFLADKVNNGTNYSGKFFRQTEDISVSTMVGATSSHKFSGTYDGDGHTLTVNYNSTTQYAAPFSYANGATFKNLHIAGSITSSAKYVASFVGYSYGSNTFLNCRSSVAITSSISGDGTHGGFVGILEGDDSSYYTVTFEGCVFNGKLLGSNTTNCGGFVGWSQTHRNIRINLTNCLYAPEEVTISNSGCQTFSRGQVLSDIFSTNTNNYYTKTLGAAQGKQARSISAGDDVTINNLGEGTEYNVSGITAYAHGIKYGGTYYAGDGDAVSLSLSHEDKAGYTFNQYSVTGGGTLANPITNSPTLTMTDANQTINVEWAFNTLTFNYTGDVQTFTVPVTGYYKLECYGAQGGTFTSLRGGYGGTSQLTYQLTQGDILYIYVGGQGGSKNNEKGSTDGGDGGWNGGGKGGTGVKHRNVESETPWSGGGGGGGATHIATSAIGPITSSTDFTSNHANLLLIAGGGGGGCNKGIGGKGGGDTGEKGFHIDNTYIWNIDWNNGTLSCGKDGMLSSWEDHSCEGCGGGGGGYVGGNTWVVQYNEQHQCYSGAGGSSWGDETNGMNYSTTAGGATDGGNGKAQITFLIQGSGTEEAPYLIFSEADWNYLAAQVNSGNSYSDKLVRLANDISVTTMVGNSVDNSFRGTFDGDGHTLTINYSNNSDFTAPFRYIQGATFKNLKVTGSITTTMNLAAGIAGLNTGSTATFEQCVTDITINSSSTTVVGWGRVDYHGGFLARTNSANVNLTDCVCGGSVDGSSSSNSNCASFVGVAENCTVHATRCLSTTSYTNVNKWNSLSHCADNASRNVSVFYYINANDVEGNVGEQVTTSELAEASYVNALQAGRSETVWAQDPIINQPMLKLFANDGKLPGEFTINAGGGKVHFSRGNLQYQASTGTWRFADNQYDNIGANNANISENYEGWIDLFGWGTSGYNHGAVCYQPWSSSTTNTDYYPYGSATANLYDGNGKADWGYNAISNGGNTENYGWRTPMKEEWEYLFNTRTTTSGIRYAKATVNDVTGVILLPDDWDASYYALNNPNTANAAWTSNSISASDWTASLEAHGAVFLPTSGNRDGANSPSSGFVSCWSSNYEVGETDYARVVYIPGNEVHPDARGQRSTGNPVRLVYEPPYFQGAGTEADPYLISSEADWNYLAGKVNTGYTFSGKYFRQTADISVTTMVGNSESNSFRGTFDGNNHTLTFTKGSSESAFNEESCAPFRHVKNATITNLQVAGTVYTSAMRASGLVATSHGALTLAGCRSSVNINSSKSGDGTHGALVAITTGSGNNVTISGCVFDGSFATTSSTNSCGGFVGWTGENTPAITNSLMKPGCVAAGMLNNTFARWQSGYEPTITNCYYVTTDNLPTDQGKQARSISAGDNVTISGLGAASATYNVSGITAYAHGIKYGSTFYAGNGEEVSLTLSHGDKEGFTFNRYTVTGGGTLDNETSNMPTLTMTDGNQEINAQWIGDNPSWSYSSSGNVLSAYGEGGYTEEDPLSITISAPADLQFDGTYKSATISNTAAWEAAGLTVPTILYNGKANAPSLLGDYTASISADEATAEVTFTIKTVIDYQSFFNNGITQGINYDIVPGVGKQQVALNNSENRGVYWDSAENCAVFDGEAYLQIDNPLGNVTSETGLTITMDVWISSDNNGSGKFIRSTGVEADKNGWQRLFEVSDGDPDDCIFINAGSANSGAAHLMWCLRKDDEVNKLEVWNNTGNSYNNQWCTVTMVVAPGGYTTLYVNGEVLTHSSSSEDVSKITNVLNYISSYNKCYIGTSIFEVIGSNADGFFIGKIRGFQTAEGALMPYFDGTNYHYLLSYATNGGNPIIGTFEATIPEAENLPTPTHPDANAVFLGWYMDEALTIPVTTGVALTKNTALYAKWINPSDYKLPGAFAISDTKRVCFSQGNLQYQASTNTWQFAEHQYNYIGNAAGNTAPSASQTAWIDLFGWATSGYNDKNPYMTSTDNAQYSTGTSVGEDFDSNYDWGTQAAGNIGNGWRTLTHAEWVYLFNTRTTSATVNSTSDARYTMATINTDGTSVNGVILFPDHFDGSAAYSGVSWGTINGTSDWGSGTSCTTAGWTALQNAGCVFLPAAGYREGTTVGETGTQGGYWSSTTSTTEASYALRFVSNTLEPEFSCHWKYGYSVRLVSETPFIGLGTEANPYLISSKEDWDNLAAKVSAGNTYNNKYFQQTADIGTPQDPITSMVGIYSNNISERRPFSGTFDGDGHVLYPSYNNTDSYLALFSNVNGATIKNLRVRGVIQSIGQHLAGLVGHAEDNVTITNCDIRPRITFTCSEAKSGGVVGELASGATLEVNGCVFGGSLEGSNIIGVAGFVWAASGATVRLTDCLFTPSSLEHLNSNESNWTFLRGSDVTHTITNCYYTQALVTTSQGKHARTITAGTDVTISGLGAASATYNVSDITAYTQGIKFGGTYYAGNEDGVSLTLSHDKPGFSLVQYTVAGGGTLTNPTTDTPTLTMTDADQIISATWRKLLMNQNNSGWMTCYSTEDLTVGTDEMETYVVTEVTSTTITTSSTEGKIYKDTPMLLKRKDSYASDVYGYVSTVELTPPTGLSEAYIGGKSTFEGYTEGTVYVLAGSEFVRARVTASTEFSPSKCFIYLTTGNASSRLSIVGDGEATGLQTIDNVTEETWYTISGRKLSKRPTHTGIYIRNGKKVVVK